jgi:hypothetical protein
MPLGETNFSHDQYTHALVGVAGLPQSPGGDSRAPWWLSFAKTRVNSYLMGGASEVEVVTVEK